MMIFENSDCSLLYSFKRDYHTSLAVAQIPYINKKTNAHIYIGNLTDKYLLLANVVWLLF